MSRSHIILGKRGEKAAALFYETKGCRVLETSWRCPFGEIDLIVQDRCCLVFCEVKTRRSCSAGNPEEQITKEKQQRYIRCAQRFLQDSAHSYDEIRFDVVAIYPVDDMSGHLVYIPNAFGQDWS